MSDPESISSGGSFPQWMKLRPDVKFDVEGGTAFSPPAHDDSFFYIRYPVADAVTKSGAMQSLSDALNDVQLNKLPEKTINGKGPSTPAVTSSKQFAKHTEPCRLFISNTKEDPTAPLPSFANVKNQTKPFGTDDGFNGEAAACGTSIVKVARQMVSGKSLGRGFTVANFNTDIEAHPDQPDSFSSANGIDLMYHPRNTVRRGSKSLPASPLGSPKSMRKVQPNPYFTGQFSTAAGAVDAGAPRTTNTGGWFLSGLLGIQRDVTNSTNSVVSNISEEAEEVIEIESNRSSGGSTTATTTTGTSSLLNPKVLKAKPSELREMNFWSPTSM